MGQDVHWGSGREGVRMFTGGVGVRGSGCSLGEWA